MTTFDEAALALYHAYVQAMDRADADFAQAEAAAAAQRRGEHERLDGLADHDADRAARAAGEAFDRAYRLNVYADDRANLVRARTDDERSIALVALSERSLDQIDALVTEFLRARVPLDGRQDVEEAIFGSHVEAVAADQAVRDALQGIKDGGPMLVRQDADGQWVVATGDTASCREALLAVVRRHHRSAHRDGYADEREAADEASRESLAAAAGVREESVARARTVYRAKLAALREALEAVHLSG